MVFRRKERERPKTQGGSYGDEYITYEIHSNKAENLANRLNDMNANGCEPAGLEGCGGGPVYIRCISWR